MRRFGLQYPRKQPDDLQRDGGTNFGWGFCYCVGMKPIACVCFLKPRLRTTEHHSCVLYAVQELTCAAFVCCSEHFRLFELLCNDTPSDRNDDMASLAACVAGWCRPLEMWRVPGAAGRASTAEPAFIPAAPGPPPHKACSWRPDVWDTIWSHHEFLRGTEAARIGVREDRLRARSQVTSLNIFVVWPVESSV